MQNFTYIILFIILLLLIGASFIFSYGEIALANLNKIRIQTLTKTSKDKKEIKKGNRIIYLREHYNKTSTSIIIIDNIMNILSTTIAAALFNEIFGYIGLLISSILMALFLISFGEILPKLLAKKNPEKGAMKLSLLLLIVYKTLYPITFLIAKIIKENEDIIIKNEDELEEVIKESKKKKIINPNENEFIINSLAFDRKYAYNIMHNFDSTVHIKDDILLNDLLKIISKNSYSRLPVINKNNEIIGILNIKFFFIYQENDPINYHNNFKKSIFKPIFATKKTKIDSLFDLLKIKRTGMVIVTENNNHKIPIGLITMNDIIEQLIGKIYDEDDIEIKGIYDLNFNAIEISSWAKIVDITEKYFSAFGFHPKDINLTFIQWINKTFNLKNNDINKYLEKNDFLHKNKIAIRVKKDFENNWKFEISII
ncbi:/ yfjD_1 / CBS domain containing protein /:113504 Reverse [Candidatus Hepatoplasma crinochetorum]|uniref:/ yfjD_1 / CBS domain containing protein /:113504 Reverse n=1 Tax=Candidatus Hepatoplasma crinochetorum TaxID=295596 RepID=A0A0G7ZM35_9MOLU|nr:/ yfjD_1 / CBS domain containing protein /:113504 Reverse [Candidatus Hepatoplasma crinochetorum]